MSIKHCQAAAVVLLVVLGCLAVAVADEDSHTYTDGEAVVVWGTQVGPYHNPQETYSYHSLPLCKPDAEVSAAPPCNSSSSTSTSHPLLPS